jgi:DNA-directed RNA polymerase specialized sigma24 family protein
MTTDSGAPVERALAAPRAPVTTVARMRRERARVDAGQGLTRMARRLLGRASSDEAQDVAQSARERMVRAIREGTVHPARFVGPDAHARATEDPWTADVRRQLSTTLRNLVTDLFRSRKRRPIASEDASDHAVSAGPTQAERAMVRQHLDALVRSTKITAFDREAYVQHELCERTLDECVEALCARGFARVDRSTVRNRVTAVRRFLADCG